MGPKTALRMGLATLPCNSRYPRVGNLSADLEMYVGQQTDLKVQTLESRNKGKYMPTPHFQIVGDKLAEHGFSVHAHAPLHPVETRAGSLQPYSRLTTK